MHEKVPHSRIERLSEEQAETTILGGTEMHSTLNDRIAQVTDETLVVGIDIGSEKHYARAFTNRAIEVSRKPLCFANTGAGFQKFGEWVEGLRAAAGKARVMVGLEPTGHYWFTLADDLRRRGYEPVLVAPQHVKHSKEMDDNTQRKDDRKDPGVIAKLVTEGRYLKAYRPEGVYAELRVAFTRRCEVTEQMTRISSRIRRWFDINFPEFREVYGSVTAVSGLMVLRKAPLPKDIVALGAEGVNKIWRDAKLRAIGMKRATTLVAVAERSIGSRHADAAARMDLWQLLEEWELCEKQLQAVNDLLAGLVAQVPNADKLLAVPGIGLVTVAGFLAEVGDISRFDDPRQIQKLAGLAIVENSSGKRKGMSQLSRRGRKRLRKVLYLAAMSSLKSNAEMRAIHRYFTTREKNPLRKMQSLMAIAAKLIRVFFGILRSGKAYDPERLLRDIRRPGPEAA